MSTQKHKLLWGRELRIVPNGIAENDIIPFVDQLLSENKSLQDKSVHTAALHELARKTVEEAERLAAELKQQAEQEALRRSDEIIGQAERAAKELLDSATESVRDMIQTADSKAAALEAEARLRALERIAQLEATLRSMKTLAVEELQPLRELQGRLPVFLAAFDDFVKTLNERITVEASTGRAAQPQVSAPSSEGDSRQAESS